ncbi:MAG TPA: hypothetical protein VGT05_01385 [Patescibacteria group bacterium]|nr:hypothetical protein [Patescibacteria group bacterium]
MFFWAFLFYLPSWLQYPRSYISSVHRYVTISGFGLVGLLAVVVYLLYKKNVILGSAIFITFLLINVITVHYYLTQESQYRKESLLTHVWHQVNNHIPSYEQHSLIYFTGEEPLTSYGIDYTLYGPLALLRASKNPSVFVIQSNHLEKLANVLCQRGMQLYDVHTVSTFHAFFVKNNGNITDITQREIIPLQRILQHTGCKRLLEKYGTGFTGETTH